jgi:hypothetical protein
MFSMLRILIPVLALGLLAAPSAHAVAFGNKGESYSMHDHQTKGKNWHVEVQISKDARLKADTVVVYVQECNATVFLEELRVDLKGRIVIPERPFKLPKNGGEGTWALFGAFTSSHEMSGLFRIRTATCDTGLRGFTLHAGGHDHTPGSSHHAGTRPGEFPQLATASATARGQARALWRQSRAAAARLFPTFAAARSEHFWRYPLKWKRPLLFHMRNDRYARDKVMLDADRPESLVYWWPKRGKPILLGFMFRAPLGKPPAFGGDLFAWHSHVEDGRKGDNQMTHVWLTGDLRSALANCLPVDQLEEAIPRFRFSKPAHGAGHESQRCRD